MKGILVLLLSLQLLSGNQLLPELAKIPFLIHHFQEHQTENPNITFFHFLKMHYADAAHQQLDASRHGDLPLKNIHAPAFEHFVSYTMPIVLQYALFYSDKIQFKQYFILKSWHDSQNLKSIFQPPRFHFASFF
jgi:hypothetical protein